MKTIKILPATMVALALLLTGCSSQTGPPEPEKTTSDIFANQTGICGNLPNIFSESIKKANKTGVVESYVYNDVVFTTVYDPKTTFDGYVGVRYDNISQEYYKVPLLENFAVVNQYEILTAKDSICVNDSKTQATITSANGSVTTVTVNSNLINSFKTVDKDGSESKTSVFYSLDDRSKEILSKPALD